MQVQAEMLTDSTGTSTYWKVWLPGYDDNYTLGATKEEAIEFLRKAVVSRPDIYSVSSLITGGSNMSVDGLNAGQAQKFATRFNMTGLSLVNGYWVAYDDGEPYTISHHNYWAAWHEGDLA